MKVVQVPMEDKEARLLAAEARKERVSRAELIRKACRLYLHHLEQSRKDEEYARGYLDLPEDAHLGQASARLAASVLPPEDWSS